MSFCGKTNEVVFVTVMNLLSVTAVALQAVETVGSGMTFTWQDRPQVTDAKRILSPSR